MTIRFDSKPGWHPVNFILLLSALVTLTSAYADESNSDDLPPVTILAVDDFEALAKTARKDNKIILLEISSNDCEYCKLLEEEILKPMLRSGDYVNTVLIRKLNINGRQSMKNFSGNSTTPVEIAAQYKITLTPTLLILDDHGEEISNRLIGIYSLDFFASRVDGALIKGRQRLLCQKAQNCTP